jgi:hypothetical protein
LVAYSVDGLSIASGEGLMRQPKVVLEEYFNEGEGVDLEQRGALGKYGHRMNSPSETGNMLKHVAETTTLNTF